MEGKKVALKLRQQRKSGSSPFSHISIVQNRRRRFLYDAFYLHETTIKGEYRINFHEHDTV